MNEEERHADFDAIVVGGGATGCWAAKCLTERGARVLLLDAGAESATPATTSSASSEITRRQQVQSRCYAFGDSTRHLFVDDIDHPYESAADSPFSWIRVRHVGGRTTLWNRVVVRMSDRQFKAASLDGHGVDWPIDTRDLGVHYDALERFFGTYGQPEGFEEVPDGVFIPLPLGRDGQAFKAAVERRWPERRVTTLRQFRTRRGSTSSAAAALDHARQSGRLTLRCNAVVRQVLTSRDGDRARAVEYVDAATGISHEVAARAIMLCASTIESVRLLLASRIANSSGLVGRHLTAHTMVGVVGVRDGSARLASGIYMPSFRNTGASSTGYLRGFGIQGMIRAANPSSTRCDLVSFGEMLTRAENCVTLSDITRDRWNVPAARIECRYSQNELEMAQDQLACVGELAAVAGFDVTEQTLSDPGLSIHEVGGARMGTEPRSSVLNPWNQCWDVPNLYVTDGAAFPSAGFQNPTLTMMALTGRACEQVYRELNA
jgi:choline dehydrogenase-like flavoprotein